ncbi:MAG: DUF938 domain-containing protein [Roseobacter sp.]
MTANIPATASVANSLGARKLHAPAAARNVDTLCELLRVHAPTQGHALEIASGTGQHVIAFARACPSLIWHPSDVAPDRLASIDAYRTIEGVANIEPPVELDVTQPGWENAQSGKDLIILVNLLHLITTPAMQCCITGAISALCDGGTLILYGPFMRNGQLTSSGDARFHADITQANPALGYKDNRDVENWLRQAGATDVRCFEMPANNLAFVATR